MADVRSVYGVPLAANFASATGSPVVLDLTGRKAYFLDATGTVTEIGPGGTPTFSQVTITGGTVTTNTPLITATQTWNDSGTTFDGFLLNVTDTASAAASKLIDLQVGGSSKFKVTKAGAGTFAAGVVATTGAFSGAVTGATFNGVTVSASSGTLSLANGSTLATSGANSITLTSTGPTNLTLPTSGTVTALGNTSTGSGSIVLATGPTLSAPVLGTPASGNLANCTGLPISTGVDGLGTGVATFLATPSSVNLKAAVTDETGSGALVFANTPTLVTPALGAATATSVNGLTISSTTGTLSLANSSTFSTSGAHTLTITTTNNTSVTLPTTGTIANLASSQAFTNKTYNGLTVSTSTGTLTIGAGTLAYNSNATLTFTAPGSVAVAFPQGGDAVVASALNAVSPTSPNRTLTVVGPGGVTVYIACKTTND